MATIDLLWLAFKPLVKDKTKLLCNDRGDFYIITYPTSGGVFESSILKDNANNPDWDMAWTTDFLTNYLPSSNQSVATQPLDTDGSPLARLKIAASGWTFQDHSFELTTGTQNSIYSKKADGTDWNFCTLKFYELISGVETLITGDNVNQTYLDANCIKTCVEWEPTHDYDVIQGEINAHSTITEDVRVWAVAVPDIPALYGGSKELISGGMNMKYHPEYTFDGRVVKHMVYSPVYHSNKIKVIFRHSAGYKATVQVCIDFYKA